MFCLCGTLINLSKNSQLLKCRRCQKILDLDNLDEIIINKTLEKQSRLDIKQVKGAKIKYQCPKCKSEEMMYNTAQLRSADEGQTVFYSCECGHKITVQS